MTEEEKTEDKNLTDEEKNGTSQEEEVKEDG